MRLYVPVGRISFHIGLVVVSAQVGGLYLRLGKKTTAEGTARTATYATLTKE